MPGNYEVRRSQRFDRAAKERHPLGASATRQISIDNTVNALKGDVHFAVAVILHQPGDDDPALLMKEEQASGELAAKAAERL
jgi:hypothetical protein